MQRLKTVHSDCTQDPSILMLVLLHLHLFQAISISRAHRMPLQYKLHSFIQICLRQLSTASMFHSYSLVATHACALTNGEKTHINAVHSSQMLYFHTICAWHSFSQAKQPIHTHAPLHQHSNVILPVMLWCIFRFLELPENLPSSSLLRSKLVVKEAEVETTNLPMKSQEDADAVPIMRSLNAAEERRSSSTLDKSWSSARYHGAWAGPSFYNLTVNTVNLTPVCNNNRKVSAGVIGQTITYWLLDLPPPSSLPELTMCLALRWSNHSSLSPQMVNWP